MSWSIPTALKGLVRRARWRWRARPRSTPSAPLGGPVYVMLRSWNRPLHVWASLDAFYRATTTPCRFVLLDNASTDPQVAPVLDAFERRGMFHAVHRMPTNDPANQEDLFARYRSEMGAFVVLADADVVVAPTDPDWLARMLAIMRRRPALGLLGSALDLSDFVSMERARTVAPHLPESVLRELVKARSPERRQPPIGGAEVINPYPPAGRLLLARTAALDAAGAVVDNRRLCAAVEAAGYEVGIASAVVHRHLSLLNLYDYPEYDYTKLYSYLGRI